MVLPFEAGVLNMTEAWVLPAVAVPIVGAPGAVYGVTALEGAEVTGPTLLVAVTVKVYGVPLVSPITV
jgi:hypothetical protein